jgi:hypothetical protein
MNQLPRISLSVFVFTALSLAPAAHAIGITIADSSKAGSEISPGIGSTQDESVATESSFPRTTTVGSSGLTASADWTFVNDATSAVFSADTVTATVSSLGATSKNYADVEFTVESDVDYSLSGGVSWTNKLGHQLKAAVRLTREGESQPIVEIDQSVTSLGSPFFPNPFVIPEIAALATGPASGVLTAGTYRLQFSVGVEAVVNSDTNSVTANFTVTLGDSGGSSEPLIGGTPVDGLVDWFLSDWFGYYNTTWAPWLNHGQHGFLYRVPESSNDNMYVYDLAMGAWWWTSESIYPFMYVFDPPADSVGTDIGASWVYYFEGTMSPRSFVVFPGGETFLSFGP